MAKPFYSLDEVSKMLGKSPDQITGLVRAGTLREFRDSGKVFFKAEDVEKLRSGGGKASGMGGGKPKSAGDTGEILLESVDDEPGRSDDSLPSLVDTSGGTSIIGLADIDEEQIKPAARAPAAAPRAPDRKEGSKGPKLGVGVFDEDDVDLDADPMAKTQVTSASGAASDQMSLKEGTGSGSGLLDLTRESDDTSLGAELLDEIYPGEDEAAPPVAAAPARRAAEAATAAAASAASASAAASRAAAAAEDEADDTAAMATRGEEVVAVGPVRAAALGDPMEPLFGMMLVWGLVLLALAGMVASAVQQGYMPNFGTFLTTRFWIFLAAAFGGLALFSLIGWLIGKSGSAPRAPRAARVVKPVRAPVAAKPAAKKKGKAGR